MKKTQNGHIGTISGMTTDEIKAFLTHKPQPLLDLVKELRLRLKRPLIVDGKLLAPVGTVIEQAYMAPSEYGRPKGPTRPGWVFAVGDIVVMLLVGEFEMMVVTNVERKNIPPRIRQYLEPCDHRGLTTMPHRADCI